MLYALFTVFVAVYATKELGMTTSNVLTAILIGSAFQLVLIPLAGALTDRFNRRLRLRHCRRRHRRLHSRCSS